MNYQKLFNYMSEEHGVTLLETDMQEICNIVNEIQFRPALPSLPTDEELDEKFRSILSHALLGADDNISRENFNLMVEGCCNYMRDFINQSPVVGEGEKTAIEKKVDDFLEKMYPFANHNREYLKTHILKFCEAKNIY